ncbi:AMP-binding protein [Streptomyces sp. NPDC002896]|uniref:class I adenylate-forming enzyme family protein n=1 Tax=Streptomyces sp. NPDC002896 TaxID=3154438 RepID=UPI00332F9885
MRTSLWAAVEERADATPDAEMLVDELGRRMTFRQYRDAAEETAAGLAALGVGEGTRVTWQLPTWIKSVVLVAALARLGAVQNPVMPSYRERELAFVTRQTKARLLIVPPVWHGFDHTALARAVAARQDGLQILVVDGALPKGDPETLPPAPESTGVRWHFYTSGTTSEPKGARHTDATVMAAGYGMAERLEARGDDRAAMVFPFAHIGGCTTWLTTCLASGLTMILTEAFDPVATVEQLGREGVTLAGAGTVFQLAYLAAQRRTPDKPVFPAIRYGLAGAAPKPPTLHAQFKAEMGGAGVVSGWGLTEAPILTMSSPHDPDVVLARCEGRPTAGVRLRVVRADGTAAGVGEEGELRAKGPQVMLGYLDAALDAEAFDAEGWLRTGDLGRLDEHGNVTITGRLKDVIIRKGETISAKEIEDLLAEHPDVAEVSVVGLPDPATGERACAVVVPADPAAPPSLRDLTDYLRGRGLMPQKLPEQAESVAVLPRNPAGKVIKTELRDRFTPH